MSKDITTTSCSAEAKRGFGKQCRTAYAFNIRVFMKSILCLRLDNSNVTSVMFAYRKRDNGHPLKHLWHFHYQFACDGHQKNGPWIILFAVILCTCSSWNCICLSSKIISLQHKLPNNKYVNEHLDYIKFSWVSCILSFFVTTMKSC